jgi:hypothetical protein
LKQTAERWYGNEPAMTINPRDFIMSPYLRCPKCGLEEYGVLGVSDVRCQRRCRSCGHTGSVYLPEIRKSVVYVDQFAFSNIMKVLSPDVKGHDRTSAEPFWKRLFELLSVVCHLQLVVCPDSREHQYESLTSPFYKALKHTYEHFSGGISFHDAETIRLRQIATIARGWVQDDVVRFNFEPESISSGRLHEWSGRIFVTVDGLLPGTVDELREKRNASHEGLQRVFESWKREKKSFQQVFETESRYDRYFFEQCMRDSQKRERMAARMIRGHMPTLDEILPSRTETMMASLQSIFNKGSDAQPADAKLAGFFKSGAINQAPFNIIAASMWASLAAKAAAGQKVGPNQGTFTDVNVVSTLLPYCDAMFVDNKCRALICDIPKQFALPYACKVFSLNTGEEFLRYLSDIRDSVTSEHLKTIGEVYGPDPMKPQSGIYGVGKQRRADSSD